MPEHTPIPIVGAPEPSTSEPLDLLVATVNSPLLPTIAIVAIGWRIISHLDAKIDRLDVKIDDVRRELESKIDGVRRELELQIDGVRRELKSKIDDVRQELSRQINDRCLPTPSPKND